MAAPMAGRVSVIFKIRYLTFTSRSCFSVTSASQAKPHGFVRPGSTHKKADRYLNKFVTRSTEAKKKKKWTDYPAESGQIGASRPTSSTSGGPTRGQFRGTPSKGTDGAKRRAKQLSAVFAEYISSMLRSGEVDERLDNYVLDISKVQMAKDFGQLNVYWLATGSNKDKELEEILPDIGFKLRHILSGLHVIGRVPIIVFVKDTHQARLQQVEDLLAVADFGEDFVPHDPINDLKEPPTLPALESMQSLLDGVKKKLLDKDASVYSITKDSDNLEQQSNTYVTNSNEIRYSTPTLINSPIDKGLLLKATKAASGLEKVVQKKKRLRLEYKTKQELLTSVVDKDEEFVGDEEDYYQNSDDAWSEEDYKE